MFKTVVGIKVDEDIKVIARFDLDEPIDRYKFIDFTKKIADECGEVYIAEDK